ncbi:hypothetical protein NECID01_1777 [Nematocida sp. AWRm77]|nr:hypothetical protein NECID01_1777 [Nematocida sp. AWRm77]
MRVGERTSLSLWREFTRRSTLESIQIVTEANAMCSAIEKSEESLLELSRKRNRAVEDVVLACLKRINKDVEDGSAGDAEETGEKLASSNATSLIISVYNEYLEHSALSSLEPMESLLLLSYIFAAKEYKIDLRGKRSVVFSPGVPQGGLQKLGYFAKCLESRITAKIEHIMHTHESKRELLASMKRLEKLLCEKRVFFEQILSAEYAEIGDMLRSMCEKLESECQAEKNAFIASDVEKSVQKHLARIDAFLQGVPDSEDAWSVVSILKKKDLPESFLSLLEKEKFVSNFIDAEKNHTLKKETKKHSLRIHLSNMAGIQKLHLAGITDVLGRMHCKERIHHMTIRMFSFICVIETHRIFDYYSKHGTSVREMTYPGREEISTGVLLVSCICFLGLALLKAVEGGGTQHYFRANHYVLVQMLNCLFGEMFYMATHKTSTTSLFLSLMVVWWACVGEYSLMFKSRFSYLDATMGDIRDKALKHSKWFVCVTVVFLCLLAGIVKDVYIWELATTIFSQNKTN